jgi:hypothetical protein
VVGQFEAQAMKAGVDKRLWEISGILKVVEGLEVA